MSGLYRKNIYRFSSLLLPVITFSSLANLLLFDINNVEAQEIKSIHQINDQKPLIISQSTAKSKPRIAVFNFDYSTVGYYSYWRRYAWGSGQGVSNILVDKLVKSGKFSVIERTKIESILEEQDFDTSGRVDPNTAAKIGRLLGAELVVFGSITGANIESNRGSAGGLKVPVFGRVRVRGKQKKANVKINVRVVNATTGEIILAAEGNGKSNQTDGGLGTSKVYVNNNSSKDDQLLTLATADAINQVAQKISSGVNKSGESQNASVDAGALIADVSGSTVIINKGSADGYTQGMKLSVEKVVKVVKDPATGAELRKITENIGTIELTEVDSSSSVGKIISGTKLKVGNVAKPIK
ncbi:MAG: CsgG/HfaB family protein [Mastigocoleus sp.]